MKENDEFVFVLDDGNKKGLYELCKEFGIEMPFEEIFTDEYEHYLFAIADNQIGLCGTIIAKNGKKTIHGLEELKYLLHNC